MQAKNGVVLELLAGCGMISDAGSKLSLGRRLSGELSSKKDYTSVIFHKPEPFLRLVRLMTLNRQS